MQQAATSQPSSREPGRMRREVLDVQELQRHTGTTEFLVDCRRVVQLNWETVERIAPELEPVLEYLDGKRDQHRTGATVRQETERGTKASVVWHLRSAGMWSQRVE